MLLVWADSAAVEKYRLHEEELKKSASQATGGSKRGGGEGEVSDESDGSKEDAEEVKATPVKRKPPPHRVQDDPSPLAALPL